MASLKSITDSLFSFLKKENQEELPDIFSSHKYPIRKHHRHVLKGTDVGFVNPDSSVKFPLADLSYGGLGIIGQEIKLRPFTNRYKQFECVISILDNKVAISLEIIYVDKEIVGCKFFNQRPEQETFLKHVLSYMDAGVIARIIDQATLPEVFHGPQWVSYGNEDGTLEVHIRHDDKGQADQISVAYLVNKTKFYSIIDPQKSTVGIADGRALDTYEQQDVLRNCIYILAGLHQHVTTSEILQSIKYAKMALSDEKMRFCS